MMVLLALASVPIWAELDHLTLIVKATETPSVILSLKRARQCKATLSTLKSIAGCSGRQLRHGRRRCTGDPEELTRTGTYVFEKPPLIGLRTF